jgi:outer membrane protein assembly factor BamB
MKTMDVQGAEDTRAAKNAEEAEDTQYGPSGAPARNGRRLRRRWRTVLAAAVAVAAIGGGVALLKPGSATTPSTPAGRGTVTGASAPLPDGFRPWRVTVVGGRQGITDELRCVPRGDAVYCGGGGVLAVRLRVSDGKEVWKRTSPGVPVQGMHLVGATTDTVIGYRIPGDNSDRVDVVALAAEGGRELWSARIGTHSTAITGQSQDAVLVDSTVLSVDASLTQIEARSAHSGNLRWATPFPSGSECAPLAAGDRIYAMCAPRSELRAVDVTHPSVHTVDRETGRLGDAVPLYGHLRPMGEKDGSLVLLEERQQGTAFSGYVDVVLLDPRTGRTKAHRLKDVYAGATPGMADGTLYFAGATGLVTAVDPATGKEEWSTQTSVESGSGPVVARGVLYFSSGSGRTVALAADGGSELWTTNPNADGLSGEVGASARAAVSGRVAFVAASGNTVFAFDTERPPKAG